MKTFEKELSLINDESKREHLYLAFRKNSIKLDINLKALEKKKLSYQMNLLDLMKINMKPLQYNGDSQLPPHSKISDLNLNNNNNNNDNDILNSFNQESNKSDSSIIDTYYKKFIDKAKKSESQNFLEDYENLPLELIFQSLKFKTISYCMSLLTSVLNFFLPPANANKIEKFRYIKKY